MLLDGFDFIGSSRGSEGGDLIFKKNGYTIHYDVSQIHLRKDFVTVSWTIRELPGIEYRYFPSLERAIRFVNTGIP